MESSEESKTSLDQIADIKRRIAEISFTPLAEHGQRFSEINEELSQSLSLVEGLSN